MSAPEPSLNRQCAAGYIAAGWSPVPLIAGEKKLRDTGAYDRAYTADDFGPADNIGVLMGAASGGLCDLDCDSPEAVALAPKILPETHSTFGRASKPQGHRLYYIDGDEIGVRRFEDPRKDGGLLFEIRHSSRCHTMFPYSVHPSGDIVTSNEAGETARVTAEVILDASSDLASTCLLARVWPNLRGKRHDATKSLAGAACRAGIPQERIERIVIGAALFALDHEPDDRHRAIISTYATYARDADTPLTGYTEFKRIAGKDVGTAIGKWLGLGKRNRAKGVEAAERLELHDLGNARRFAARNAHDARYCPELKTWFFWTGKVWESDTTGEAYRRAHETVEHIADETARP